MRGLFLKDGGAVLREDLPEPGPLAGECRIQVLVAGICATDLALARGYLAFSGVPGHEFVGVALEGPLEGKRVVGEINAGCRRCPRCAEGDARHCPQRTVLGILGRSGAFAERIALPVDNLHQVPDALPPEAAVFVEPLAAAFEIGEQIAVGPDQEVLVAGDGRLGLLCAQALHARGARVTVAGHHPERQALLPGAVRFAAHLLESAPPAGRVFDVAVEATGRPETLARLVPWVRPRGTIVLKTTAERPATVDLAPLVVDEITVVGSRCGPFPPAIAALAAGVVRVDGMVARRFPLAEAPEALRCAARGGILKVLLEVSSRTVGHAC